MLVDGMPEKLMRTEKFSINKNALKIKNAYVYGSKVLKRISMDRRKTSDKRSNGAVLVIGGSSSYHGAPALSGFAAYNSLAALRAGAGYVKAVVPSAVLAQVRGLSADIIVSHAGKNSILCNGLVKKEISAADAMAIGMGFGRSAAAASAARKIISIAIAMNKRVVIDADAIRSIKVFAGAKALGSNVVITPNEHEFSFIAGPVPNEVSMRGRINAAEKLARAYSTNVVLKGHATIITDGVKTTVNKAKSSALAVMGTGDVLSGIIAGLAVNTDSVYDAAVAGVYLHSAVGDMLYKRIGAHIIASDVAKGIPAFFQKHRG